MRDDKGVDAGKWSARLYAPLVHVLARIDIVQRIRNAVNGGIESVVVECLGLLADARGAGMDAHVGIHDAHRSRG